MEAMDEEEAMVMRQGGDAAYAVTKGKRTKRQRLFLPHAAASPSSTELSGSTTTTEEEEDMANCLILLAQGPVNPKPEAVLIDDSRTPGGADQKFKSRRFAEAATTTNGKAGFYVYECKTCSKCFPSFQALGGHRASHKKPKIVPPAIMSTAAVVVADEDGLGLSLNSFAKPFVVPAAGSTNNINNSISSSKKTHECSICGAEFSSGQALGGHMRRHRPIISVVESPETKKEDQRNILSLDLNLPAPSEEGFSFAGKQPPRPLIFSASALVDCHY